VASDPRCVEPRIAHERQHHFETWRDGSKGVVLEPLTLIERLCALIPRRRHMLVTCHGVLAPAAGYRHRVVPPAPLPDAGDPEGCRHQPKAPRAALAAGDGAALDGDRTAKLEPRPPIVPHAPSKHRRPRARHSWAELMRREIDVLTCPHCGGPRQFLAAIFDQDAIRKILTHLGLPTEPPTLAPARAPPEPLLPW
jgi:hypothetical protein